VGVLRLRDRSGWSSCACGWRVRRTASRVLVPASPPTPWNRAAAPTRGCGSPHWTVQAAGWWA